jgi:hypothetical protein
VHHSENLTHYQRRDSPRNENVVFANQADQRSLSGCQTFFIVPVVASGLWSRAEYTFLLSVSFLSCCIQSNFPHMKREVIVTGLSYVAGQERRSSL